MADAAQNQKLLTVEEFAELSLEGKVELIDGVVVRREDVPGLKHGMIAAQFTIELGIWARRENAGAVAAEVDYIVARDPDRTRRPDISFIRRERVPGRQEGYLDIVPDLIVEIGSPNDKLETFVERLEDYRRLGVPLIWEVHPGPGLVIAHTTDGLSRIHRRADVLRGGDVLPGFECPVSRLLGAPPATSGAGAADG